MEPQSLIFLGHGESTVAGDQEPVIFFFFCKDFNGGTRWRDNSAEEKEKKE